MTFYRTKGGEWIDITEWQQKRDDLEDRLRGVVKSALRLLPDINLDFKPKGERSYLRPDVAKAATLVFNIEGRGLPKPTVEPLEEVLVRCGAIRPYDPSIPSPIRVRRIDADGKETWIPFMRHYDTGEGFEGLGQVGRFEWVILKDGKYFKHHTDLIPDRLFMSAGDCMVWLREYVHEWGSAGVDEFEKAVREVMFALGQEYKFECVTEANRFCD
eukprot:jgi/Mesvir1/28963/Mv17739-RA.1